MPRKKKRVPGVIRWFLAAAILVLLVRYHKEVIRYGYKAGRWYSHLAHRGQYKKGIIDYPYGYAVHGVDVSRWQDEINWSELKSKTASGDTMHYSFAFIKATEGIWLEDPMFKDNWKEAAGNGIIRGAYHYFNPASDARLQAKNFISSVNLKKGDLPPVVDIEETNGKSKSEIIRRLKAFNLEIEKHYGVKPVIYSNINFIENYLSDDFPGYSFWVAHYYEEELVVEKSLKWVFWQHNDRASVFGCNYPVDVNVFNGSRSELRSMLMK